jgi:hypothetical protein
VCPASEWTCRHCSLTFSLANSTSHLAACPSFPILCNHSAHGCPFVGIRGDLDTHISTACAFEPLKAFFEMNDARLRNLERNGREMLVKFERIENVLDDVKTVANRARRSLGPWYSTGSRSDGPSQRMPPPAVLTPRAERTIQRRRLSIPLTTASFPARGGESEDEAGEVPPDSDSHADRYSSQRRPAVENDYFGEAVGPTSSSILDTRSRSASIALSPSSPVSSFSSTQILAPADPYSHQYPALDSPYFLPLPDHRSQGSTSSSSYPLPQSQPQSYDPGPTSLHATISHLTNTLATLSSSLSSLDRHAQRQELALTTETLRMHEDVASLRAIVHGLRVQVHGVLMERNQYQQFGLAGYSSGGGGYHWGARLPPPGSSSADGDCGADDGNGQGQAGSSGFTSTGTGQIESNGVSRPSYTSTLPSGVSGPLHPPHLPPTNIMMSVRRTSGATENKL